MDHGHHHHHNMDSSANITTETPSVASTMASVVQAVLTTVMTTDHHGHNNAAMGDSSHSGSSGYHVPVLDSTTMDQSSILTANDHHLHKSSPNDVGSDHMLMYFHAGVDAIVLFKDWNISTTQGLLCSVIGIFFMAMLYEGIKFYREHMFKRYFTSLDYSSVSVVSDDGKTVMEVHKVARNRMFSWPHLLQTFLHMVQMVLSYFLMLIFMTYNVWLCLGVVLGSGTGYFLFGWRKATVVDISEHCN